MRRAENLSCYLVRELAGRKLEAFGRPANASIVLEQCRDFLQRLAKSVTRHGDKNIGDPDKTIVKCLRHNEIVRKCSTGQVPLIGAVVCHRPKLRHIPAPQTDITTAACELKCERRAPGARADDGNRWFFRRHREP